MEKHTFKLCNGSIINSHGFRIDLEGMDTERFQKNPMMLYGHDRDEVIGRWENLRIENNCLLADAVFDTEDEKGKEVARQVEQGFLRACSMGIYIHSIHETEEEVIATKTELLEASIVSIPSDSDAVMLFDNDNQPRTFEEIKLSLSINQNNTEMNDELKKLQKQLSQKEALITKLEAENSLLKKDRVEGLINQAIAEKKITADEKEAYITLAESNYSAVEKILAAKLPVSPVVNALEMNAPADKYAGKTWDQLDAEGLLASLKAEDPDRYNQLFKQKFN